MQKSPWTATTRLSAASRPEPSVPGRSLASGPAKAVPGQVLERAQMTHNSDRFDAWVRGPFVQLNTQLEELYFAQADRAAVEGVGAPLKRQLVEEGREFIV